MFSDEYILICLIKDASEELEDLLVGLPYLYNVEAIVPWSTTPIEICTNQEMLRVF